VEKVDFLKVDIYIIAMTTIQETGQVLIKQNNSETVKYSSDGGTTYTDIDSWPVTLVNTNAINSSSTLKLQFETDLTFNSIDQYFIIGTNTINIDGSDYSVYINVEGYPGLVQNGTYSVIGNYNVAIKNINVYGEYTVANYGGWIGQKYFGIGAINNTVNNCLTPCTIGQYAGGIIGAYSGAVSVTNCISSGNIDYFGGGIFGAYSLGSASNCQSSNVIGEFAGGIFGAYSDASAEAINCSSSSGIGLGGGGIFGAYGGGTANTCVSNGDITGSIPLESVAGGGIFGTYCRGTAYNCFSTGKIGSSSYPFSGGIFGSNSSGTSISCGSYGAIGDFGGGILGAYSGGLATNCYSSGSIGYQGGGIAGAFCYGLVTNCGSTGPIGGEAGGIYGYQCKAEAQNCWSTGSIGNGDDGAGGIFGSSSAYCVAQNCYSTGEIGTSGGGIFGQDTGYVNSNKYITDALIGIALVSCAVSAVALVGVVEVSATAVAGLTILGRAADTSTVFFTPSGNGECQVLNCYSTGKVGNDAGAFVGLNSKGTIYANTYSTDGGDWNDYAAEAALDMSAWTDPDLESINVPYILSSMTTTLLYNPSVTTNATTSGEGFEYCSHSIISINGNAQENYPSITIDSSTGIITFGEYALSTPGSYAVNVLSTYGQVYYSGTFTNTIQMYNPSSASNETSSGDAFFPNCSYSIENINGNDPSDYPTISINSNTGNITFDSSTPNQTTYAVYVKANPTSGEKFYGTYTNTISYFSASDAVLIQQTTVTQKNQSKGVTSVIQYSTDNGQNWVTINAWPLTMNNATPTLNRLNVQFNTGLSLDSVDQYFIIGTSDIFVDGNNNVVTINIDGHPGLIQNGTSSAKGKSNIKLANIGITSSHTLASNGGWLGQSYFGKGALYNVVNHSYSTGNIGENGGGIFGQYSEGQVINCYSTGIIGINGGGIIGANSSTEVSVCYSTGTISDGAGGIFGQSSSSLANAFNSYSTGTIGGVGAGGIFGQYSSAGVIARNCYSMGNISGKYAGGIFGQNSDESSVATNCYSLGTISGQNSAGIFGFGNFGSSPYCYRTNGHSNWSKSNANASLNTSENVWTDIDPYADSVPYKLTAFYLDETLYSPSSGTNVSTEKPVLTGDYEWVITSVNGSTSYSGVSINNSTGVLTFNSLAAASSLVNVLAVDSFRFYSFGTFTNIISNICFPAGTPIVTDQGIIPIDKINTSLHTIRNKKIVAITKTITNDKYLVKFDRHSLGMNMPSKTTVMSKHHSVFFNGRIMEAKEFTHEFSNVTKIPYKGEILYNVLLEQHDKIMVNNLTCETLHPDHLIARLYKVLPTLSTRKQMELIMKCNQSAFKRSTRSVNKTCNEVRAKMKIHF
jgi:hypothetical protein